MAFNGSGAYSLPAGQPVVTGTTISSTTFNTLTSDLATALSLCITKDGQQTVTANIPFSGYRITGIGAATDVADAVRASQAQNSSLTYLTSVSGADTITASATPTPAAYVAGQRFTFIPAGVNTGAVTLNVSSLGARAVTKFGTTALVAGDIPANAVVDVEYDGTQFQLMSVKAPSNLTMNTARVLGRTTASTGAIEELTVGSSLSLAAGALNAALASQAEAQAGTENTKLMTALRVAEAIAALAGGNYKVVYTTRDVSTASGNVAVTGAGFTPKAVIVAGINNTYGAASGQVGFGFGRSASEVFGFSNVTNASSGAWTLLDDTLFMLYASGTDFTFVDLVSLDADGCTLSYTKFGSHTGTANIAIMFIG